MLKLWSVLPATTIALTLTIGGCEEGDFQGEVGEPDVQTEQPLETDADVEMTEEPGVGEEEMFEEGDAGVFEEGEQGTAPAVDETEPADIGDDTTTADPVEVDQDVAEAEANQQQEPSQPEQEDADAVEEVPAESLPGDQQSGGNQGGQQGGNQ